LGQRAEAKDFVFVVADLTRSPLPFEDAFFDSVSAFDVIEHIPRVGFHNEKMYSPFIELMNEIHRILVPGGLFLASTPAYPHPAAFQDPTHVNVITDQTHNYFCGPAPYARRYGFKGEFSIRRAIREPQKNLHDHYSSNIRKLYRSFEYRYFKGGLSHITWELLAVKASSP
jgi:SAM-dependent methyltransferase